MSEDFLVELGHLGITARLKRLSDSLSASIRELYQHYDLDIEPSWHLIFLLLEREEAMTMVDIAEELHFSQPALTRMTERMKKRGFIEVNRSLDDGRKKYLKLSDKARALLPQYKKIWDAGQRSIAAVLDEIPEFSSALRSFEQHMECMDFKKRALRELDEK